MLVNLSEAKTNLSNLVNRAYQGEKITIAKHNIPMVDLVVHTPPQVCNIDSAFGILKDQNIDGLELQEQLRNEW